MQVPPGNILVGQHGPHSGQGACCIRIYRADSRVGHAGAQGACVQHAREMVVVREFRLPADLGQRIRVGLRLADFVSGGTGERNVGPDVLARCLPDGVNDALVAGATAIGVFQRDLDVALGDLFTRGLFFIQQSLGCHDQAGCADAALNRAVVQERLLQRMQAVISGKALDGLHAGALRLESGVGATDYRRAFNQHGADAALGLVAADFRSGQAQVLANDLGQEA